jgi:hypothetical protein
LAKKVDYIGEFPVELTTLGIHVEPGDKGIEVADDFEHPLFVPTKPPKQEKGGDVDAASK